MLTSSLKTWLVTFRTTAKITVESAGPHTVQAARRNRQSDLVQLGAAPAQIVTRDLDWHLPVCINHQAGVTLPVA